MTSLHRASYQSDSEISHHSEHHKHAPETWKEYFLHMVTWTDTKLMNPTKALLHKAEFDNEAVKVFEEIQDIEERMEELQELFGEYMRCSSGALYPAAFLGPINELEIWQWGQANHVKNLMNAEVKIKKEEHLGRDGHIVEWDPDSKLWTIELYRVDKGELHTKSESIQCKRNEFKVKPTRDYFQTVFAEINESKNDDYYSWLSEFFDLILVASVVKIAENTKTAMKEKREYTTAGDAFGLVVLFYTLFLEHTMLWTRFTDVEGRLDDYFHKVYGLGMCIMAVFIPKESRWCDESTGIVWGWCVSTGALLALHVYYRFVVSDQKCYPYCKRRIVALGLALLGGILALTAFKDEDADFINIYMMCCALPIMMIEINSVRMTSDIINPTTASLSERLGIFVLILLGESILALVLTNAEAITTASHAADSHDSGYDGGGSYGYSPTYKPTEHARRVLGPAASSDIDTHIDFYDEHNLELLAIVAVSFCIMMTIYIMYFNGHIGASEYGLHALDNAGFPGACTWVLMHLPFGYFLVMLGTSMKLLVYKIENFNAYDNDSDIMKTANSWFYAGLLGVVMCNYLIRSSHKQFKWQIWPSYILRPCPLFLLLWGFMDLADGPVWLVVRGLIVMICITVIDTICLEYEDRLKKDKRAVEAEHELAKKSGGQTVANTPLHFEKVRGVHRSDIAGTSAAGHATEAERISRGARKTEPESHPNQVLDVTRFRETNQELIELNKHRIVSARSDSEHFKSDAGSSDELENAAWIGDADMGGVELEETMTHIEVRDPKQVEMQQRQKRNPESNISLTSDTELAGADTDHAVLE